MSNEVLLIERDIQTALGRYARACDTRDWALFDTVFAPDAIADYGNGLVLEGREAIIASIRSYLGGCGPSQHMLGNFVVTAAGKSADSRCYVRAFHRGRGDDAGVTYEVMGEYRTRWRRLAAGWRAVEWGMAVDCELGSRDILGPSDA
jgi:hypothetical protein